MPVRAMALMAFATLAFACGTAGTAPSATHAQAPATASSSTGADVEPTALPEPTAASTIAFDDPAVLATLPDEGIAVQTLDGDEQIAHFLGPASVDGRAPEVTARLRGDPRTLLETAGFVVSPAALAAGPDGTEGDASAAGEDCEPAEATDRGLVVVCQRNRDPSDPSGILSEQELLAADEWATIDLVGPDGDVARLVGPWDDRVGGSWEYADVSPDGEWLLLMWMSDGCGVTKSFVAPANGGEPVLLDDYAGRDLTDVFVVGWDSAGRAVASTVGSSGCGGGQQETVLRIDVRERVTTFEPTPGELPVMWQRAPAR